jgi:hypothetical protein
MSTSADCNDVSDLSSRISRIEDIIEIRELTARYNRAFDDVEPEAFANTFIPDGEFEHADRLTKGHDRLMAMVRACGFGSVHMTLDAIVKVEGDTATQECFAIIGSRSLEREPGSAKWAGTIRYKDDLVRTSEGWRFQRRLLMPDAYFDNLPEW